MIDKEVIVHADNLIKAYKGVVAVNSVTFNVHKGEILGLVGKNGAGKTTLIRLLTGIAKPNSGSFTLFGDNNLTKGLSKVSTMIEHPALYLSLSGKDNMMTACYLKNIPNPIESGYIKEKMEFVGLGDMYDNPRKAGNYSLGMKQRLGIAMAMIGEPELMMLDEPTNGLDPEGIRQIREVLTRLNQEKGITMIVSSHILSELSKFATSYLFLNKGRVVEHITESQLASKEKKTIILNTTNNELVLQALREKGYQVTEGEKLTVLETSNKVEILNTVYSTGVTLLDLDFTSGDLEDYFLDLLEDR